jgi:putative pyruvate formate lyase activating enzyme
MRILRPDSIEVLKDSKARKALTRYFKVVGGEREPVFKTCKSIPIEVSLNETDENLWREHQNKVEMLRKKRDEPFKNKESVYPSLLDLKVEIANRIFRMCAFCERRCGIDRFVETGVCKVSHPRISSMFHHYGEEPELVPSYTIFFSGCNFHCQFCQNHDISQSNTGFEVSPVELAKKLMEVRARNVNWVGGSPTPNLNFILETLKNYDGKMPSVWNSNMHMSTEAMSLLEGTQDVFLTDLKYGNDECAERLSKVKDYTHIVKRNHLRAAEQTEVIVRHLVLPNHIECCTREVASFVSNKIGPGTRFNLMFQYRPVYWANRFEEINRPLNRNEMDNALEITRDVGLKNVIL